MVVFTSVNSRLGLTSSAVAQFTLLENNKAPLGAQVNIYFSIFVPQKLANISSFFFSFSAADVTIKIEHSPSFNFQKKLI